MQNTNKYIHQAVSIARFIWDSPFQDGESFEERMHVFMKGHYSIKAARDSLACLGSSQYGSTLLMSTCIQ